MFQIVNQLEIYEVITMIIINVDDTNINFLKLLVLYIGGESN